MKKRLCSIVLTLCMIVAFVPTSTITASAATAPTKLWVASSDTNNIPMQIDAYKAQTGGTSQNPTYTYQLYLPGNADLTQCYLFWDGEGQVVIDDTSYPSGTCLIPQTVNTEQSYVFKDGNTTLATLKVITYQGSSAVPPVFIDIDETQGTIQAMKDDKSNTCSGVVYIGGQQYTLTKMKGRGNATWDNAVDKKPYNITLGTKINFPGIDSKMTKKWSLLAEVLDRSLLCNRSGYWLAHELGIGQDTNSADVWMNGEYQGCYTVTPKTDSFVTDDGYMIEQDNYQEPSVANGGDPQFSLDGLVSNVSGWSSAYNLITVKKMGDNLLGKNDAGEVDENPENMTAKAAQIQTWLQDAWDAIRSDTGYNSKNKYYTEYIDIESFAKMYLMHEYVKSYDVCAGSILFHRDGATDADKLFAGPLWDLDNAMGSVYQNRSLGVADNRRTNGGDRRSAQGSFIQNVTEYKTSIYKTISKHSDFMEEVDFQYNKNKAYFDGLENDVTQMISNINASATMNHIKVTDIGNSTQGENNHYYGSNTNLGTGDYIQSYVKTTEWANYAANLKTYIHYRSLWFASETDGYYDPDFVDPATCEHQYELVESESTPATCTAAGLAKYKCPICKDTKTEVLPKIAHNYENGVCTVCQEPLITVDIVCDEKASVTVYPTQTLSGTCVENATSANPCDGDTGLIDCGGEGQINFVVNVAPGYAATVTATPKNYNKLKTDADPDVPNSYRITKVTGAFTINVTTNCTHAESYLTAHAAVPVTCESDGSNAYWSCSNCGKYFSDAECTKEIEPNSWIIPATDHAWDEGTVTTQPSCTEKGVKTFICKNDSNHTKTEEVPALGHTLSKTDAVAVSCETAGNSEYWTCSVCNKYFSDAEGTTEIVEGSWVLTPGHVWGEWIEETPATEETEGSEYRECNTCGFVETRSIPMLDHVHSLTMVEAKNPTCTESGNIEYWKCTNTKCGRYFTDATAEEELNAEDVLLEALNHDYQEVTEGEGVAKDPTCIEAGRTADQACTRCDSVIEGNTIPALGHSFTQSKAVSKYLKTAADCTHAAVYYKSCSRCGVKGTTTFKHGSAHGHTWDAGKVTKEATTTHDGVLTYTCKVCKATKTETIPQINVGDTDSADSAFHELRLRSTKQTNSSISLSWKSMENASKYVLYGNKCGKTTKLKELKTFKAGKTSYTLKSVLDKSLQKGTYYKLMLLAYDKNGKIISTSKKIHVVTKGGKYTNFKSVTTKAKDNKVTVKVGKTFKLQAKAVKSNSSLETKTHRAIKYEKSKKGIVTVSSKGVITGKKKGTCYVYVYTQNGVFKTIKVTVN